MKEIDLTKVTGEVFDLTDKAIRESMVTNQIARNFAKGSQEVLLKGFIPPNAITLLK